MLGTMTTPVPGPPVLDPEHCYRTAGRRDGRFDGTFVTAVSTTGTYREPSCPAVPPRRPNGCFHPAPAAALRRGLGQHAPEMAAGDAWSPWRCYPAAHLWAAAARRKTPRS